MNKKFCPHCYPILNHRLHLAERFDNFLSPCHSFFEFLARPLKKNYRLFAYLNRKFFYGLFKMFLKLRLFKEVEIVEKGKNIHSRTLVIIKEAKKRNLIIRKIEFLGKTTNFFSLMLEMKNYYFEGLPHLDIGHTTYIDFDDKYEFKKILKKNNIPHTIGKKLRNYKEAYKLARKIGFPLVVKPLRGSLSQHITVNIISFEKLKKAVKIAKQISLYFVLERYIPGKNYRIMVVDKKFVACCLRELPNIIGDGRHNIVELIKIKNKNILRGDAFDRSFTLHKIIISRKMLSILKKQDLSLKNIPERRKKIYLDDKIILACGADIHDKTEDMHPLNKILFEKIAGLCKTSVIGFDFIADDISRPYLEQECALIEANSMPNIDMHHFPTFGSPQNVAGRIIDFVTAKK